MPETNVFQLGFCPFPAVFFSVSQIPGSIQANTDSPLPTVFVDLRAKLSLFSLCRYFSLFPLHVLPFKTLQPCIRLLPTIRSSF